MSFTQKVSVKETCVSGKRFMHSKPETQVFFIYDIDLFHTGNKSVLRALLIYVQVSFGVCIGFFYT